MSQDEQVDIVDSKGNFLEVAAKQEAHKRGLLHKCVISQMIDSNERWLLIKPASGRQDAGQYVSPMGGHVSAGESEEEALKREVREEIGLEGDFKHELVGRGIFNRFIIGRQENHLMVMYKIYSNAEPILNHEHVSYKYFTEEELKKELAENPQSFGDAFHFVAKSFFPHLR